MKDEELPGTSPGRPDPLTVQSVLKAFSVLHAFGSSQRSLSLAQIAALDGMGKSAAQRFAHTLTRLGYLAKDPQTRRFEPTARTLPRSDARRVGKELGRTCRYRGAP